MHNFQPGKGDTIDNEEFDEVEEILEFLTVHTEINILGQELAIDYEDNDYESEMDDDENISVNEDLNFDDVDSESLITDSENEEVDGTSARLAAGPCFSDESSDESSKNQNSESEKRVIDDYDPDNEDDEVVKKIITEQKKPRSKPANIDTKDFTTDLSFHPRDTILAVATVTGDVLVYRYQNEENTLLQTHEIHSKAVRDIEFSIDGRDLISASRDKSLIITDFETGKFKRFWENAHSQPIYTVSVIDENLIATGDDDGTVKLWDSRVKEVEPIFSLKEVEDYISKIITNNQKRLLVCTSGDGLMTTFNIASKKMYVQSEPYEEELTCEGIFRNESKLVVGTSKGNFYTFNWGEFGYHNDAFTGPSTPISLMVPVTERIAITAGEEGVIRAMHLFPGRILGIVGQHSLAVETMDISHDGELIATSSHDNDIRFWNIKYFEDFDGISYNSKPNKATTSNNLPSSLLKNRSDFFADLAD